MFTKLVPYIQISIKNNVAIVFVDYPLAPEVKFPVIHEVSYNALSWLVENGASINVDTNKLAIAGGKNSLHTFYPFCNKL